MKVQNLSQLDLNQPATIIEVEHPSRERVMTMGFHPGLEVIVLKKAPFGGPLKVLIEDTAVSIRRADARFIHVN